MLSFSATDSAHADVVMPQMGASVFEGTVVAWLRKPGDRIEPEEVICEISTDKIDAECPSPAGGTLTEILVAEGETVEVGTVIARIAVADANGLPGVGQSALGMSDAPAQVPPPVARSGPRPRLSPLVKRIAADHEIDPSTLEGTGRGGRVTKADVLAAVEEMPVPQLTLHSDSPYRPDQQPTRQMSDADGLGGVAEPLTRIRKSIGAAMLKSQKAAATCHTVVECDMSAVESRRRELGITALPLVARATIDTLREFPYLNATLDGTTITRFERVHLGIAVSLGDEGLIVPVIHDAQELSVEGLGSRIKELAGRARAKELSADEVRGATFTITNPGQYGALLATPIIAQPQVGILDLEAIIKRPVVITTEAGDDLIAVKPMINLVLGWDHRAMDGVYAASFLSRLRSKLSQP